MSAQVAEALRDGDPLRPIVLTLRLAAPEARALTFDLEFDIAAGQISNATAFEAQRQKRLQSRANDIGLDRPFGLVSTAFCVGRSQAISFVLNDGQPIPSGADAIKAVIYWYDRRHEHPALLDIANFDLSLIELNPDLSEKLPALQESKSTRDNKERVLFSGIAGKRLKLKVSAVGGIDPNFIYGTCSVPGALRVALAALWEDSTRNNDLEGPFWFQDLNIPGQPWIGVEPEDLP